MMATSSLYRPRPELPTKTIVWRMQIQKKRPKGRFSCRRGREGRSAGRIFPVQFRSARLTAGFPGSNPNLFLISGYPRYSASIFPRSQSVRSVPPLRLHGPVFLPVLPSASIAPDTDRGSDLFQQGGAHDLSHSPRGLSLNKHATQNRSPRNCGRYVLSALVTAIFLTSDPGLMVTPRPTGHSAGH